MLAQDIIFDGGLVHIIDSVLAPPLNILDTIVKAGLSNSVATLAASSNIFDPKLFGSLGGTSDWTSCVSYCPHHFVDHTEMSQSFLPYHPELSAVNIENWTQADVFAMLEYHGIQGTVAYSPMLTDGKTFKTVQGGEVTVTVLNGSVYVNAAKIIDPDYLISNGVLHVIDRYFAGSSQRPRSNISVVESLSSLAF